VHPLINVRRREKVPTNFESISGINFPSQKMAHHFVRKWRLDVSWRFAEAGRAAIHGSQ